MAAATAHEAPPAVALLMPGQGAQYPRMGMGLYSGGDGFFRRELDHCARLFVAETGADVREALLGDDEAALRRTDVAQPALFAVEYAVARTLEEYGVRPTALGGHSIGEFTAACLAGVMELGDAVRLVAARGRLMHHAPAGAMLHVRLREDRVRETLAGTGLDVAAVNEPEACAVAGPPAAIDVFAVRMRSLGVEVALLRTAHAFHTAAMDEAAERFAAVVATVRLSAPKVPLVSNVTGGWMTDAEATDPERWAVQMRGTVRWADCVRTLLEDPGRMLVEAGPGRSLGSAARRSDAWSPAHRAVSAMRHAQEPLDDGEALSRALGALWEAGGVLDWSGTRHGGERWVSLPGYPFRRDRHWTDPACQEPSTGRPVSASPASPVLRVADAVAVLTGIWSEVLGVVPVRPDDDFFDLGGDSMLASRVAARARERGVEFEPKDVFENPTVLRLAARVSPDA